jgi:hypothetical protein
MRSSLYKMYSSTNIIRMIKSWKMKWTEHAARMGKMRNAYQILVTKPEGNRPLGRPEHRWEDNIKMNLRKIWLDLDD